MSLILPLLEAGAQKCSFMLPGNWLYWQVESTFHTLLGRVFEGYRSQMIWWNTTWYSKEVSAVGYQPE